MAGNQSAGPQARTVQQRLAGLAMSFRSAKVEHLFAGISGGVVSTLILHPLDLLKIRFAGEWNILESWKWLKPGSSSFK